MRRPIALAVALSAVLAGSASAAGYAQVSFVNQTSVAGDLYVDQTYGCRALARLFCTTQVLAGVHTMEVRFTDGEVVAGPQVNIPDGQTFTFTVGEAPPG